MRISDWSSDVCSSDLDRARLVGDRAGDRLPDPPGRIGRELVAAAILELVDRLHQTDIAFLNEIQELQAAVRVLLGDRDSSEERRVGKECCSTCRSRWSPDH